MTTTDLQSFELNHLRELLAQADAKAANETERGVYTARELAEMTGWSITRVRAALLQLIKDGKAKPTQKRMQTIAGDMHHYAAYRLNLGETVDMQASG